MNRLYLPLILLLVAAPVFAQDNAATRKLTQQSKQFEEQIVKVADKVHVAVGFSPANVSMIVGDDGVVIVDTGMTRDDADRIVAEFRKITDKPVKAIIFTHSHGDHTGGVTSFLGAERPQIWAHNNFGSEYRPLTDGTPNRSVRLWADSLNKMSANNAVVLVGGHTKPIIGADEVKQVLGDYRDAVQFIHDKTVEGMNKGMTPDELVEYVQLPEHLASKDYLQPFYGHPEWGVRTVFSQYFGWFDGNPSNLFRLTLKSEAERVAKLAGGKEKLLSAAKDALANNDNQWAAQLADHLLAIDRDDADAKQIKADALTKLASNMVNATARNYYLTVARELREGK